MRVVTEEEVQRFVTIKPIIGAIETAFKAFDRGESEVFPVVRAHGSDPSHTLGVKSGRDGSTGTLGVKVGSYNPSNRERGLKTHAAITLLLDDVTSEPRAVVQANYLNGLRTAAVDALAVRELAREDATVLGVIGAGNQSMFEIEAIQTVRAIKRVLVADKSVAAGLAFAAQVRARTGVSIELVSAEAAVRQADILVTATPSREVLFDASWVSPGLHISAMGADNYGKNEIPLEVVRSATLYVDYPEQAILIGETQHAFKLGLVTVDSLQDRTLGALLTGRARGRTDRDEVTVFDSSGIAIQDLAAAQAALDIVTAARAVPRVR